MLGRRRLSLHPPQLMLERIITIMQQADENGHEQHGREQGGNTGCLLSRMMDSRACLKKYTSIRKQVHCQQQAPGHKGPTAAGNNIWLAMSRKPGAP